MSAGFPPSLLITSVLTIAYLSLFAAAKVYKLAAKYPEADHFRWQE